MSGLNGGPPERPRVYMNRAGTLGGFRWLANNGDGWHHALRVWDLTTGKLLHDLTTWKNGGWIELLNERYLLDDAIYDRGKLVGRIDTTKHIWTVSPDEKVALFASTNDNTFSIVELATATTKHKGSLPNRKKGDPSPIAPKFAFTSDGKTVWTTIDGASGSIDIATGKTALGTPPVQCP